MSNTNQILSDIEKLQDSIINFYLPKLYSELEASPLISLLGKASAINSIRNPLEDLIKKVNIFIITSNGIYNKSILNFLGVSREKLKKLQLDINAAQTSKAISELIENTIIEIDKFNIIYNKTLPTPEIYTNDLVSYLVIDIKEKIDNFDKDNLLVKYFSEYNDLQKFKTSKTLVDIRNILYKEDQTLYDGIKIQEFIDDIFNNIKNIEDTKKLVDEVKEIAHDVKVNITKNNNEKLVESFATEAKNINTILIELNRYIIISFITIILILLLKSILIIYYQDSFKDIYNMIVFLSVILSISGLLTYLIKERKYNQKLHDFYNKRYLELNALPEYMQELTPEQRKELIIQLAPIYFIGNYSTQPIDKKEIETGTLDKKLDEITKIINNIKELKK
ncbi:hypothetical protein AWW72_16295 [Acinetobacter sp. NRRL B-65365]|uniref:hypothetical protein n=1 Tax=Acinetobacter sp. NRRL B-65365 TaxID=1785092 RepID=UPI0007A05D4A|nr:hypothetical protein [Acinetobacter sp. NRRL B-65365]KYQ82943.1 hypothetical protein AWW72_16295 [Acinetobacter sp. NRRL B-65365]